jgi:N-acetylated-alpha-linked acidic dipeptidase
VRDRFRSWGWAAEIEEFEVLFPTPKERVLEMVAPSRFVAKLREPAVPGDASSAQQAEQLPSYNAYSIDGDVTAPLVFVNYGIPADYERLERLGISVRGAIVIAKYGGSWRGIKPKVAAEHGAVGCLIYSDPQDDGYGPGDVYPKGPYRPADGVQRGSVMDMPLYPGDPLTPGIGATAQAHRLAISEAQTLTKIPVLPISYADAQPLLAALAGPVAPAAWRGGLAITYKIGPGPARVHLRLAFNWDRVRLNDVIARIPGSELPDEWIIRGNHRDGWVNGAEDPLSGLTAELEEARAIGQLLASGWRPRRTIVYAAWDGEEEGLLGSTEWAETHADELSRKAVLYLNSDVNGRGILNAAGSHTLERLVNDVARDITDPETGLTAWKREQAGLIAGASSARDRMALRSGADLRIDALGSGSDYTPFIQHLGIASLNLGFGGEGGDGIYHSIYDNFEHYTRFNDTSFVYGRALAQTAGSVVLRVAGSDILPYRFENLTRTAGRYVEELKTLVTDRRDAAIERNRELDDSVFQAIRDPREILLPPSRAPVAPFLNFAPLDNALEAVRAASARYESALARAQASGFSGAPRNEVNAILLSVERSFTSPEGLPRRPWFRHLLYAPGFYTGYGVKTIPGVREAIEQNDWKEAEAEIGRVSERLSAAAGLIGKAADLLEK